MAAIAEKPTAAATAQHVLRKVGPLTCRFSVDSAAHRDNAYPTPESIAERAIEFLHRTASLGNQGYQADGWSDAGYRKTTLDAKAQRDAAKRAVKVTYLQSSKGEDFKASELAPLVTLVRKALNAKVRAHFRDYDKRKRVEQREAAKAKAAKERAKAKRLEKAAAQAVSAVLPENARPVKVTASKDSASEVLRGGALQKVGRGATATWMLVCTDSYQATMLPLTVNGNPGLRECVLPAEALKAIQEYGAFRFTKDGRVQPVRYSDTYEWDSELRESVRLPRVSAESPVLYMPTDARFPRFIEGGKASKRNPGTPVPGEPPATRRIELTFDARILLQVQEAFGKGENAVTIQVDVNQFDRGDDKVRRTLKPVRVVPRTKSRREAGLRAVQMPVRADH